MKTLELKKPNQVSVAGCLGYDVLAIIDTSGYAFAQVSVAGCLGYDVLERKAKGK